MRKSSPLKLGSEGLQQVSYVVPAIAARPVAAPTEWWWQREMKYTKCGPVIVPWACSVYVLSGKNVLVIMEGCINL